MIEYRFEPPHLDSEPQKFFLYIPESADRRRMATLAISSTTGRTRVVGANITPGLLRAMAEVLESHETVV